MSIEKAEAGIRIHAMIMIGLLFVQYLLGMTTNLFVTFPDHGTGGQLWEFAWSQWPEASHIVVGSLLLIGALVLIGRGAPAADAISPVLSRKLSVLAPAIVSEWRGWP